MYVSDRPRRHDFDLLRRLVLPDGSILRAQVSMGDRVHWS